jgi:hypothetical protein
MARILLFLLFAGAGYGLYQAVLDYKAYQKTQRNLWPEKVVSLIKPHSSKNLLSGNLPNQESTFFQLLYATYQIDQDGYPLIETLKRGASLAGVNDSEAQMIATALLDNLNRARSFGVFQDPSNLLKLERGSPPVALASGWENEPLVIGFKISPLLGAELMFTLPNMIIMPASVRNLQSDLMPPEAEKLTTQWLGNAIISPECALAIREKVEQDSKTR